MNTAVNNSLTDYLKVLRPDISSQLISSDNWSNINTVARILPSAITSFFGFECRLGIKEARADFLICADATEAGRQILASDNKYSITLPDLLGSHSIWNSIQNFSTVWNTETSPLYHRINNVWLEFDIDDSLTTIPIPSCFFGPQPIYSTFSSSENAPKDRETNSHQWITQNALKVLLDRDISPQVERQLFKCIDLLPSEAYVFQIGVMLSRKSDLIRVCIRNISPKQILEYLTKINWQGSLKPLKELLDKISSFAERIDLDIDVGESVRPKIGLECYFNRQPKFEPRWQLLLDYLVENNLCIPEKRDSLLAYPGYIRQKDRQDLWPSNLLKLSQLLGAKYERIFFTGLHHIKLTYQQSKTLEAKAYLYANLSLLNPQFFSQWKQLTNSNNLVHS
ncbi:MAG: hypothetical protein QNJ54_04790 [Prochloraceae cyanobacterium]|nr:hypothetical protein [Prochloraceae cyanobacterium]